MCLFQFIDAVADVGSNESGAANPGSDSMQQTIVLVNTLLQRVCQDGCEYRQHTASLRCF